jgi:F0F1-type ATP synthase membrane subunit c/vacuolar-type H+-ATPase subunit K
MAFFAGLFLGIIVGFLCAAFLQARMETREALKNEQYPGERQ